MRRNPPAGRQMQKAHAGATFAKHAEMLMRHTRQFAVGHPLIVVRPHHDRRQKTRFWKFYRRSVQKIGARLMRVLVDLAPIRKDAGIYSSGERASFCQQLLPRGIKLFVRVIRKLAWDRELKNESYFIFLLLLRTIGHTFRKVSAIAWQHVSVI